METIDTTVKFILYNAWSYAYLLENTMATNHGLLEEDEVFYFTSIYLPGEYVYRSTAS